MIRFILASLLAVGLSSVFLRADDKAEKPAASGIGPSADASLRKEPMIANSWERLSLYSHPFGRCFLRGKEPADRKLEEAWQPWLLPNYHLRKMGFPRAGRTIRLNFGPRPWRRSERPRIAMLGLLSANTHFTRTRICPSVLSKVIYREARRASDRAESSLPALQSWRH